MTEIRCLKHKPEQSYQNEYAYPPGYPVTSYNCSVPDCQAPPVIWLNPEENKEYERGERRFWEVESLDTILADNRGLGQHHDSPMLVMVRRWGHSLWLILRHLPQCLLEAGKQSMGSSQS